MCITCTVLLQNAVCVNSEESIVCCMYYSDIFVNIIQPAECTVNRLKLVELKYSKLCNVCERNLLNKTLATSVQY